MKSPENLKDLPEDADLKIVGETINYNYTLYHIVADQLVQLQNWIRDQATLKVK